MLVDETSLRRGHRYVTAVSNGEIGAVLAVVRHRDFRGPEQVLPRAGQRVVLTRRGRRHRRLAQLQVGERHLGGATHVVDRFHVVRWFASGRIEVRHRVKRIGEYGDRPAFVPGTFTTRYLQLARADGLLSSEQFARLSVALTQDPELWHAWRMLQMPYDVYDAVDEEEAKARTEAFVLKWSEGPIPGFRVVLKALARWVPEISSRSIAAGASLMVGSKREQQARRPQADRIRVRERGQLRGKSVALVSRGDIMTVPSVLGSSHKNAGGT